MGRHCLRWYMVDEFTKCTLLNAHRGRLIPALRGGIRRRNQAMPSVDRLCHLCPIASPPVEIAQLDWLIYGEDVMAMIVGGESGDSLRLLRTNPTEGQTRAPLVRCPGSWG